MPKGNKDSGSKMPRKASASNKGGTKKAKSKSTASTGSKGTKLW